MPKSSLLLTDQIYKKASKILEDIGSSGVKAIKLKAIISAKDHGITQVAKIFKVSKTSIIFWIKRLDEEDLFGLESKPKKPRSSLINHDQKKLISNWIRKDPNLTIKKIRLKIFKEFGISVSKTTTHRIIKTIGYSHMTARPQHYKQDPIKLEDFKKNSNQNQRKKSK